MFKVKTITFISVLCAALELLAMENKPQIDITNPQKSIKKLMKTKSPRKCVIGLMDSNKDPRKKNQQEEDYWGSNVDISLDLLQEKVQEFLPYTAPKDFVHVKLDFDFSNWAPYKKECFIAFEGEEGFLITTKGIEKPVQETMEELAYRLGCDTYIDAVICGTNFMPGILPTPAEKNDTPKNDTP